jgi:hypothetical protein
MALMEWRSVPPAHRRWIVVNSILISAAWNLLVNGFVAWVMSAGHHRVPLWSAPLVGGPNLLTGTLGTLFLLPFLTCVGVTIAVRKAQKDGVLDRLEPHQRGPAWLAKLPESMWRRSARLGLLVLLLGAPVAIPVLAIGFSGGISRGAYIGYSALSGLVLGLVVTSFIALAAMGSHHTDASPLTAAAG